MQKRRLNQTVKLTIQSHKQNNYKLTWDGENGACCIATDHDLKYLIDLAQTLLKKHIAFERFNYRVDGWSFE